MATIPKILVIEDDTAQAEELWKILISSGFEVSIAFTLDKARFLIEKSESSLIVIGVAVRNINVFSFIRELKLASKTSYIPVIAMDRDGSTEQDCVRAIEAGADGYMRRPFGASELVAYVKALLRPIGDYSRRNISFESIRLDLDKRRAFIKKDGGSELEVALTHRSFELLGFFIKNPYRIVTWEELIENVWQGRKVKKTTITVGIHQLRMAIETVQDVVILQTMHREGYRLTTRSNQGTP
ncbi:response regulator transcription factor [Paraburkholderia sp. 2C]|jgi:two-component system, OmpR family, phosphate regulon response regulator PhoB